MAKSANVERIHKSLRRIEQKANVAAWIILDKAGEHIGTVRISYPRDGIGRLQLLAANWAAERPRDKDGQADFSNWTPWQYGWASGCGYDKGTAAASGMTIGAVKIQDIGTYWHDQLRDAGYRVIQAV